MIECDGVVLIVSGIPGAGKTTMGRALSRSLDVPMVDKDDLLEALFETDRRSTREELSRQADAAFLEAVRQEREVVAVSFWRRPELSTTSGTPTEGLANGRSILEVWCDCPAQIARDRFLARSRHPRHQDRKRDRSELLDQLVRLEECGPIGLGEVIRVDTRGPVDVDDVVRQLRSHWP